MISGNRNIIVYSIFEKMETYSTFFKNKNICVKHTGGVLNLFYNFFFNVEKHTTVIWQFAIYSWQRFSLSPT